MCLFRYVSISLTIDRNQMRVGDSMAGLAMLQRNREHFSIICFRTSESLKPKRHSKTWALRTTERASNCGTSLNQVNRPRRVSFFINHHLNDMQYLIDVFIVVITYFMPICFPYISHKWLYFKFFTSFMFASETLPPEKMPTNNNIIYAEITAHIKYTNKRFNWARIPNITYTLLRLTIACISVLNPFGMFALLPSRWVCSQARACIFAPHKISELIAHHTNPRACMCAVCACSFVASGHDDTKIIIYSFIAGQPHRRQ